MPATDPDGLLYTVRAWDVPEAPHCSNCRHAIVQGDPDRPTAYCAQGHGGVLDLWKLIRRSRPIQFKPAMRCPLFSSMGAGDDEAARRERES